MNDVQHFEASRALAERVVSQSHATADDRIRSVFSQVLFRQPDEQEMGILRKAYAEFVSRFANATEDAEKLVGVGESSRDTRLAATDVAAMAMLCNLVLNLDEAVTRD
jgi:hypothetical protein